MRKYVAFYIYCDFVYVQLDHQFDARVNVSTENLNT